MQTRFLRDRLQRCRGELSQIVGMARDLERMELDGAQSAPVSSWNGGGRYGGPGAYPSGRHQSHAATTLNRIQQAADHCASSLSEIEREVEMLTEPETSYRQPTHDAWERGRTYGGAWEGGNWSSAPSTYGYSRVGSYAATGSRNYASSTFGGTSGTYSSGGTRAYPRSTFRSTDTFENRRPAYGASTIGRFGTSQYGGFDYGYGATRPWDAESNFRGSWTSDNQATWEREPAYSGAQRNRL